MAKFDPTRTRTTASPGPRKIIAEEYFRRGSKAKTTHGKNYTLSEQKQGEDICKISRNLDSMFATILRILIKSPHLSSSPENLFGLSRALYLHYARVTPRGLILYGKLAFSDSKSSACLLLTMSLGFRYLTKATCQHLVRFREHRPRHGLKDKELIYEWIQLHSTDQFKDDTFFRGILAMHDVQSDEVLYH
ncbi:hypothetical protein C8R44DRAFT_739795 [Mycena epipterygia]|nr:hypothetical protein C8R44DRAFT_739795 [Mycena epipterygia]